MKNFRRRTVDDAVYGAQDGPRSLVVVDEYDAGIQQVFTERHCLAIVHTTSRISASGRSVNHCHIISYRVLSYLI